MTTLGIVGGLGPESTIDYYRRILEAWKRDDPASSPSIVIDSLDVDRGLRLVEHDRPALVLGGTELTLLLSAPIVADIPALDTTALHVAAIVKRLRS
jgi:aspartate racemase